MVTKLSSKPESHSARKRVVVVGSDGRLGSCLMRCLQQDHQAIGLGRAELELASPRSIRHALERLDYDALFLTAALTGVDYCEEHQVEAYAVNAEAAGRIAAISAAKGAHLTYISTDLVFDGLKETAYIETDTPKPLGIYGASKLAGEKQVIDASPHNLVVRTSWVFGPGRPAFPEWIIDKACEQAFLRLPEDKVCCPTYTPDLSRWLAALVLDHAGGPASGVFHLCNAGSCSWLEWGQCAVDLAREAGVPVMAGEIVGVPLESVMAFVARRPANSALNTGKFTTLTGIRPRPWRAAMRDFLIQNHGASNYKPTTATS